MKRYEGLFILNTAGKEEGIKDTIDKIFCRHHRRGRQSGNRPEDGAQAVLARG
ncbi:MAG: hypothetical protein QM813_08565 [Verrucomicrobiota bacterium]